MDPPANHPPSRFLQLLVPHHRHIADPRQRDRTGRMPRLDHVPRMPAYGPGTVLGLARQAIQKTDAHVPRLRENDEQRLPKKVSATSKASYHRSQAGKKIEEVTHVNLLGADPFESATNFVKRTSSNYRIISNTDIRYGVPWTREDSSSIPLTAKWS